jgi:hypothetical protein
VVSLVGIEPVLTQSFRLLTRVESLLIPQDICSVRTLPEQARFAASPRGGGRTWWAHFKFTLINIALTIHKNQFEAFLKVAVFSLLVEEFALPFVARSPEVAGRCSRFSQSYPSL